MCGIEHAQAHALGFLTKTIPSGEAGHAAGTNQEPEAVWVESLDDALARSTPWTDRGSSNIMHFVF
jgi:hypothetical protein